MPDQIKKYSLKEKNQLIIQMINEGTSSQIKHYLSKELDESQLLKANYEQTLHQVLLARFLSFHGATISPIRIANKVIQNKLSNNNFSGEELSKLYYQIAVVYFELYSARGIEELYIRYSFKNKNINEFSLFLKLIYYQSQISSGKKKYNHAMENKFRLISKTNSLSPLIEYSIKHFTVCNLIYSPTPDFKKTLKQLETLSRNAPASFITDLKLLKKKIYINLNKKQKQHLDIEKNGKNLYHMIENLFLDKFYYNQKLQLADEVMLHCYPTFNEYSFLLGNRFYSKNFKLSKNFLLHLNFIESFRDKSMTDHWLIDNNSITNSQNTFGEEKLNILNLATGLYVNSKGKVTFLGEKKSTALMIIISTGSFGASDFLLAERVYAEENISQKTACQRIQDLITQLKKIGFPLLRSNRKIYFIFDENINKVLIPKTFFYVGELGHIQHQSMSVNKLLIQKTLRISPRASSYKIKEWKSAQLLKASNKKKGEYTINFKNIEDLFKNHYTQRML